MRGWLRLPALRLGDYSNVSPTGRPPQLPLDHPSTNTTLLAAPVPQVVGYVDVEERAPGWIRSGPRRLVDDGDA